MSSAGDNRKEADVGPLLNELVVLWMCVSSGSVTLHLLYNEPTLTAIINASDLQVTTNHSRLDSADIYFVLCVGTAV